MRASALKLWNKFQWTSTKIIASVSISTLLTSTKKKLLQKHNFQKHFCRQKCDTCAKTTKLIRRKSSFQYIKKLLLKGNEGERLINSRQTF